VPWVAIYEGEKSVPREVPIQEDVKCPECGGTMRVWRKSSDGRARHFKHIENFSGEGRGGTACESVGESQKHRVWKSFAADRLEQLFDGNVADCRIERELAAPVSGKDRRLGDAVVEFETRDEQLGNGVIIEVQHRNESKDIRKTTADYIAQGFAVVWTDEYDYATDNCRLNEADIRKLARDAVWPEHVPKPREWWGISAFDSIQEEWFEGAPFVEGPAVYINEWGMPTPKEEWENTPWDDRFPEPEDYSTSDCSDTTYSITVPIAQWLLDETGTGYYRQELMDAHAAGIAIRNDKLSAECPDCGTLELHDPLSKGEVGRSTTCRSCGKWYDVEENAG